MMLNPYGLLDNIHSATRTGENARFGDSRIVGNDPVPGYQGWGDFRGRLNLPLIVETLLMRCVAPAPSGVSTYAQPWFAIFQFPFLFFFLCAYFHRRPFG